MTDPALKNKQRYQQILDFIERMPSLSTTVTKVLAVCNRPDTSPNDLNRVISLDPVLTGQVLKLINSAYYSLPNRITTLTRAIIMLGPNTVKNLVLGTAALAAVGRAESFKALSINKFWTHSICVGVTAKALAIQQGVSPVAREEFFVAGLLHDLGKVLLNHRFAEEYRLALELTAREQGDLAQCEKSVLGVDHGLIGGMIARKWQLSQNLIAALAGHHQPEMVPEGNRQLVATVALANVYANVHDFGSAGDPYPNPQHLDLVLQLLALRWRDLEDLRQMVQAEIEKAQVFLRISHEGDKS